MKKCCVLLLLIPSIGLLQFCTATKTAVAEPSMTYVANISPVMITSCSPCHFPPKGKKIPLDNYESVKSNIDEIIESIEKDPSQKGFMPFKHAKLSDSTIALFNLWKKDGLAEK